VSRTLVIVPTLNEAPNVARLLPLIATNLPDADILVVDDRSEDGTAERVREVSGELEARVELVVRDGPRGLGRAYSCGFEYGLAAGYEQLLTMDADFSHDPRYLPDLVGALVDHDVVVGARYIVDGGVINWGIPRILLSWSANRFAQLVLGLRGNDLTSGYRAYRRRALELLDLATIRSDGYSFLVELLFCAQRQGLSVGEVPIVFIDRAHGRSKISKREIYRGAFTLLRLRLGR
jgi:dolichol-phosphate mannosyltransferase